MLRGVRLLRLASFPLAGREFDLVLVALRAGETTPAGVAARLGVRSGSVRTLLSRSLAAGGERARLLRRDPDRGYRLTGAGARRADAVARKLLLVFAGLRQL